MLPPAAPVSPTPAIETAPSFGATAAPRPHRCVVVKLGTRVVTQDDGRLALGRLSALAEDLVALRDAGDAVVVVSSGAVGLGADALGLARAPAALGERQACAAIGQGRLMQVWRELLGHLGATCGQVLVTEADLADPRRLANLQRTLHHLLALGVLPIVNENDAVATEELALRDDAPRVFGDNDRLSALLAAALGADLLVLLTDVPAVRDADGARIARCDDGGALAEAVGGCGSGAGRGGMRSKVESAALAARAGCCAVIASGREPGALRAVADGANIGTRFPARDRVAPEAAWQAFIAPAAAGGAA